MQGAPIAEDVAAGRDGDWPYPLMPDAAPWAAPERDDNLFPLPESRPWGLRAQVAAAIGQRQAAVYEAEQIRLTLAQAVAAQYFAWQAVNEQQRLLQQRIEAAAESEKILKQRIRAQLLPASAAYPAEQAQQLLRQRLEQRLRQLV